ncbi:uncharacterized protein LOC129765713 [Toxorhynchites rutilus septentrionalis]|uniref:uncharacterized protein LOC129765713 n=1 Tax=Toxorhynchites rutilus septentrionalis TaxID=329112 RepID=UPI002478BCAD|nr:uncharacterized protein LOC129765713 [Toxorhynchites rutilus septentrionalis]
MDASTDKNCLLCDAPDTVDDMVQCGQCELWAHYGCAGVDDEIKKRPWSCPKCANLLQVQKPKTKSKTKSGSKSDAGSVKSVISAIKQLEEEQAAMEKELEEEKELREKRLVMEKTLREKRMEQERDLREKEFRQQQELREKQLLEEREMLERNLAAEEEFLRKQHALREQFQINKKNSAKKWTDADGAVGGGFEVDRRSEVPADEKVKNWLKEQKSSPDEKGDPRGAYPKNTITKVDNQPTKKKLSKMERLKALLEEESSSADEGEREAEEDGKPVQQPQEPTRLNQREQRSYGPGHRLTQDQLAARQVMSKQLPVFKGEPEVWPLFISSFENTTKACGFTNLDNLKRLQDCLLGEALEAVRSRLILPESVPGVISDLRNLFGKPEKLLKAFLMKVRRAPSPKAEKLETFLHFGITVKQLCDHLEAAGLADHLNNPMLVQELVDKLPPHYKLDWVRFKRFSHGTPLRMFTDFMSGVVSDVSEVAEFSALELNESSFPRNKSAKKREFVHMHSAPPKVERPHGDKAAKPCWMCKRSDHKVRFCDDFKKLNVTDRLKVIEKHKLGVLCLNNHGKSRCSFKLRCSVGDCQEYHHPLLHRTKETVQALEVQCNTHSHSNRSIIFRMVPVSLSVGDQSVDTLTFLDEGSSVTLIEETIANQLQAKGTPEPLIVSWTGNMKRYEDASRRVDLMLSARDSDKKLLLLGARTVSELVLPKQEVRFQELTKRYAHLRDLPVADSKFEDPKIIIGLDNLHVFAPLEARIGRPGEPIGVRSKIGWTIYGPEKQIPSLMQHVNFHMTEEVTNQELHDIFRIQYDLEQQGVSPTGVPESEEDLRAREILRTTTIRVGDHFETGLLWRKDERNFPDSYNMAKQRLLTLERRLEKKPQLREKIRQQVKEYQLKQYAHLATEEELSESDPATVWYLPLNVVENPRKPGKVRLVWDAAAAVRSVSLNSELLKGPDMLISLPSVICRFRERRYGFGGDIKEMYHQIKIRKEDKNAQRFLFRNDSADPEPQVYIMDVATFGATCSPCSAQFIKNLNAGEFASQYPEAAAAIANRHYVDDYYDSADTIAEAVKLAREVKYIHSRGGFHIRNWVSNSEQFVREMGEECVGPTVHFKDKSSVAERVLGVSWNTTNDAFLFTAPPRMTDDEHPTKRSVLSHIMSMYDPIGFLSPFTVQGKILVQDLWRTGCEWDEPIEEESHNKWRSWINLLPEIEAARIPRAYFGDASSDELTDVQLHILTDASEKAIGCVAYFRVTIGEEIRCALVMSRTKVAPLKQLTIPRLELQAAVMGARLAKTVCASHSIKISRKFFWTDSQTVLSWIRSDQRQYKPFVGFRIGEILDLTRLTDWRWVPTKYNVADRLTKWSCDQSFDTGSVWFKGPCFLYQDEADWPQQSRPSANTAEELRAYYLFHDVAVPEPLVDVKRISKWSVLVRTVACVFRFISNCRRKVKGLPIETLKPTQAQVKVLLPVSIPMVRVPLKQKEFRCSECFLIKIVQAETYGDELKVLTKNQQRQAAKWYPLEKGSPLYKLTPLLDPDGVIRMEGRTGDAEELPFELRFPIILPRDHEVTRKIILHFHERYGHGFRETVKNELRQRYFIPNINAAVRKVASSCLWCKVHRNQPRTPRMAPLPNQRLSPYQRAFCYTGVDYFGPVEVSSGRSHPKRWVVLFTCLVMRAVHLEVASDLTAASCLMAIRRFVGRRGTPLEFWSDNGTNLKAAGKEIFENIRVIEEECADAYTDARTKWRFIPPASPHMGGSWERLVRTVKEALVVILDGKKLTDEILHTAIIEAEDMVNSRPLVYVAEEASNTITPNHFLRGVSPNEPLLVPPPPHSAEAIRNAYYRSQELAEQLWQRWVKEYVPMINQRSKWFSEVKPLKKGDLVYVVDGKNRKLWVRGVVVEPIVSKDGRVRQAWVRTSSGVYRRPTTKLAVLEIDEGNAGPDQGTEPGLRAGDMLETTPQGTRAASSENRNTKTSNSRHVEKRATTDSRTSQLSNRQKT